MSQDSGVVLRVSTLLVSFFVLAGIAQSQRTSEDPATRWEGSVSSRLPSLADIQRSLGLTNPSPTTAQPWIDPFSAEIVVAETWRRAPRLSLGFDRGEVSAAGVVWGNFHPRVDRVRGTAVFENRVQALLLPIGTLGRRVAFECLVRPMGVAYGKSISVGLYRLDRFSIRHRFGLEIQFEATGTTASPPREAHVGLKLTEETTDENGVHNDRVVCSVSPRASGREYVLGQWYRIAVEIEPGQSGMVMLRARVSAVDWASFAPILELPATALDFAFGGPMAFGLFHGLPDGPDDPSTANEFNPDRTLSEVDEVRIATDDGSPAGADPVRSSLEPANWSPVMWRRDASR